MEKYAVSGDGLSVVAGWWGYFSLDWDVEKRKKHLFSGERIERERERKVERRAASVAGTRLEIICRS